MKVSRIFTLFTALAILVSMLSVSPIAASASGVTRQIPSGGTSSPQTGAYTPSGSGDATQVEFPGQMDAESGPEAYSGSIVNRSLSQGQRQRRLRDQRQEGQVEPASSTSGLKA